MGVAVMNEVVLLLFSFAFKKRSAGLVLVMRIVLAFCIVSFETNAQAGGVD